MPRLEVNIDVEPEARDEVEGLRVAGTVRHEGGPEVEFVGWVSLLALLQQAVMPAPAS